MKTKLLKKVRKKVKIYKRNNEYYVLSDNFVIASCFIFKNVEDAKDEYRRNVLVLARYFFGKKYKSRIL